MQFSKAQSVAHDRYTFSVLNVGMDFPGKHSKTLTRANCLIIINVGKKACSVKVWCTKTAHILRIVVQTGANLAV